MATAVSTVHSHVSAGGAHSLICSHSKRTMHAFGSGRYGQLGTGLIINQPHPVVVGSAKLSSDEAVAWNDSSHRLVHVAAGNSHSAALTDAGHLYVWGRDHRGQVGMGDIHARGEPSTLPRLVTLTQTIATSFVAHVACGVNFTVAVDGRGAVYSWGIGVFGNLGHGDTRDRSTPTRIEAFRGHHVVMVACGAKHTLALARYGEVYSFGHGDNGRLGVADSTAAIGGGGGGGAATDIYASSGGLAAAQTGQLVPRLVPGIAKGARFIAAGEAHSVAVSRTGLLYTWGAGSYGRLGHGVSQDFAAPHAVATLTNVRSAACGVFHTMVVTQDGGLWSFGGGSYGQLGLGGGRGSESGKNARAVLLPQEVQRHVRSFRGYTVREVACGDFHTICIADNRDLGAGSHVLVWGFAVFGRLGLSGEAAAVRRQRVRSGGTSDKEHAGGSGGAAGSRSAKQQTPTRTEASESLEASSKAIVVNKPTPLESLQLGVIVVPTDDQEAAEAAQQQQQDQELAPHVQHNMHWSSARTVVRQIACGARHSAAVTMDGRLFMWGSNDHGQLGDGMSKVQQKTLLPTECRNRAELLRSFVAQVACGEDYTIVLNDGACVFSFGRASEKQLGVARAEAYHDEPIPVILLGGLDIVALEAGETHAAALTRDGALWTWGSIRHGKLGRAKTAGGASAVEGDELESGDLPARVLGALATEHVAACSLGMDHSLVLTAEGDVFAFGSGWYGRLGTGETYNEPTPVRVGGVLRGRHCTSISAGAYHSLAVAEGALYVWGRNEHRLGVGPTPSLLVTPTRNEALYSIGVDVVVAAAGESHSIAIGNSGAVYSWGSGADCKLGHTNRAWNTRGGDRGTQAAQNEAQTDVDMPSRVCVSQRNGGGGAMPRPLALSIVVGAGRFSADRHVATPATISAAVATYRNHCLALSSDGSIYAWGGAGSGRLGLDLSATTTVQPQAARVSSAPGGERWELTKAPKSALQLELRAGRSHADNTGLSQTRRGGQGEASEGGGGGSGGESSSDDSSDSTDPSDEEDSDVINAAAAGRADEVSLQTIALEVGAKAAREEVVEAALIEADDAPIEALIRVLQTRLKGESDRQRLKLLLLQHETNCESQRRIIDDITRRVMPAMQFNRVLHLHIDTVLASTFRNLYGRMSGQGGQKQERRGKLKLDLSALRRSGAQRSRLARIEQVERLLTRSAAPLIRRITKALPTFEHIINALSAHPMLVDEMHRCIFGAQAGIVVGNIGSVTMPRKSAMRALQNHNKFVNLVVSIFGHFRTARQENLFLVLLRMVLHREVDIFCNSEYNVNKISGSSDVSSSTSSASSSIKVGHHGHLHSNADARKREHADAGRTQTKKKKKKKTKMSVGSGVAPERDGEGSYPESERIILSFGSASSIFGRLITIYFMSSSIAQHLEDEMKAHLAVFLADQGLDLRTNSVAVWHALRLLERSGATVVDDEAEHAAAAVNAGDLVSASVGAARKKKIGSTVSASESEAAGAGAGVDAAGGELGDMKSLRVREETMRRVQKLILHTTKWLQIIVGVIGGAPHGVRVVCKAVHSSIRARMKCASSKSLSRNEIKKRTRAMVAKFIVERWIRPALQDPKRFNLVPSSFSITQRQQLNIRLVVALVYRCLTNTLYTLSEPAVRVSSRAAAAVVEMSFASAASGARGLTSSRTFQDEQIGVKSRIVPADGEDPEDVDALLPGAIVLLNACITQSRKVCDGAISSLVSIPSDYLPRRLDGDIVRLHLRRQPLGTSVTSTTLVYLMRALQLTQVLFRPYEYISLAVSKLGRSGERGGHSWCEAPPGAASEGKEEDDHDAATFNLVLDHTFGDPPAVSYAICSKCAVPVPARVAPPFSYRRNQRAAIEALEATIPAVVALENVLVRMESFPREVEMTSGKLTQLLRERLKRQKEANDLEEASTTMRALLYVRSIDSNPNGLRRLLQQLIGLFQGRRNAAGVLQRQTKDLSDLERDVVRAMDQLGRERASFEQYVLYHTTFCWSLSLNTMF